MRREKIGVHHANAVVWGPVYRTHLRVDQVASIRRHEAVLDAHAIEVLLERRRDDAVEERLAQARFPRRGAVVVALGLPRGGFGVVGGGGGGVGRFLGRRRRRRRRRLFVWNVLDQNVFEVFRRRVFDLYHGLGLGLGLGLGIFFIFLVLFLFLVVVVVAPAKQRKTAGACAADAPPRLLAVAVFLLRLFQVRERAPREDARAHVVVLVLVVDPPPPSSSSSSSSSSVLLRSIRARVSRRIPHAPRRLLLVRGELVERSRGRLARRPRFRLLLPRRLLPPDRLVVLLPELPRLLVPGAAASDAEAAELHARGGAGAGRAAALRLARGGRRGRRGRRRLLVVVRVRARAAAASRALAALPAGSAARVGRRRRTRRSRLGRRGATAARRVRLPRLLRRALHRLQRLRVALPFRHDAVRFASLPSPSDGDARAPSPLAPPRASEGVARAARRDPTGLPAVSWLARDPSCLIASAIVARVGRGALRPSVSWEKCGSV
eukprot:31540-Pelagococcus_subviridis.AAC.5